MRRLNEIRDREIATASNERCHGLHAQPDLPKTGLHLGDARGEGGGGGGGMLLFGQRVQDPLFLDVLLPARQLHRYKVRDDRHKKQQLLLFIVNDDINDEGSNQ